MSPTPPRQPTWTCPACGSQNEQFRTSCRNCRTPRSSAVTPFSFPATGQQVRTVILDGEPWFVAADVCAVLGYGGGARNAITRLPDRMKGVDSINTPGGIQRMTIVSEPGVYRLVMRSNLPDAEAFQDWIAEDVVPTIRRTGTYSITAGFDIPRTLPEALRAYAAEVEAREAAEQRAAELEGPAEAWHVLASAEPDYSVREAAYILNRDPSIDTGQNRLFNELRRLRVIDTRDIPYADHARHVKLRARSFTNRATGEETPAKPQVRITAEGLAYLHKKLGGTSPLQLDEQFAIDGGA